jgi:hypothetical protein
VPRCQIRRVGADQDRRVGCRRALQALSQISVALIDNGSVAEPGGECCRVSPGASDLVREAGGTNLLQGAFRQAAVEIGGALFAQRGDEPGLCPARLGKAREEDNANFAHFQGPS